MISKSFLIEFHLAQQEIHLIAVDKGWWDNPRTFGDLAALMVCEIAEAVEYHRANNPFSNHIPGFTGIEEEMADTIIRIMDAAQHNGWKVAEAIAAKVEFNKSRSRQHGGKII